MKGNYRFSLAGQGTATLVVNDSTIFTDQRPLGEPTARPADVPLPRATTGCDSAMPVRPMATPRCGCFGERPIRTGIAAGHGSFSRRRGSGVVGASTSNAAWPRPVRRAAAAEIVTRCRARPTAGSMPELAADAPRCAGVGSRLRPAWIAAWLLNPPVDFRRCDHAAGAARSAGLTAVSRRPTSRPIWRRSEKPGAGTEAGADRPTTSVSRR